MGPLTHVTGRWWKPLGEEKIMGCFFCQQNIMRVSASLCLITLETKLNFRGGLVVLRGHWEKTLIPAAPTVMIFINLGAV